MLRPASGRPGLLTPVRSEVVETSFGLHLILVTARKPGAHEGIADPAATKLCFYRAHCCTDSIVVGFDVVSAPVKLGVCIDDGKRTLSRTICACEIVPSLP